MIPIHALLYSRSAEADDLSVTGNDLPPTPGKGCGLRLSASMRKRNQ